ncbi:MAG TPA: hypothetical protein VL493_03500 [Candidatus Saccharimonadales bacterium]|jgi:hypothetical protein|nr:hypothetical protein [Candidatus Saccharimonadales bacterium]
MTRIGAIATAIAVVVASFGILSTRAAAHETRMVGPYTFVVGWVGEPAVVGQSNGLDLTVTETAGGKAVEGLEKTLTAQVITGGGAKTRTLELAPDGDQPGHYTSGFVPTRVGDYTFHLSGMAGTTKIDEKFESGPNRFDAVTDIVGLEFPDQVPSTGDLAQQLSDANTKLTIAIAIAALALVVSIASFAPALRRR